MTDDQSGTHPANIGTIPPCYICGGKVVRSGPDHVQCTSCSQLWPLERVERVPPHREDITVTMPKDMWQALIEGVDEWVDHLLKLGLSPGEQMIESVKVVKSLVHGVPSSDL